MKVYQPKQNLKRNKKVLVVAPDYVEDPVERLVEDLKRLTKRRKF